MYTTGAWREAYQESINPIDFPEDAWFIPEDVKKVIVLPPETRRLVALFKYASGGRWRARCLNGIQSTKMEEVRNGMAKDVLFRSGLKGYKSDKKIQEQQDRRDSCPRCPSFVPPWALMREAELYGPEQGSL
ncbi:hypothetical protein F2Q68_00029676 [Brassica cretica]|uniref:Uncharacterized protein n=1 Tax=Brassica cretica TaxID=69181 RepID=A0A8S9G6A8_BRACR|nr:hypothetical protein F2Q68_00029676 [Brassica cretica]